MRPSVRSACVIPATMASFARAKAPSEVLAEIGRLTSLVIESATSALLSASERVARRTKRCQAARSPSCSGLGWYLICASTAKPRLA